MPAGVMGKYVLWPILLGVLILVCCSSPPANNPPLTILIPDDIVSLGPNERFETNNDSVLFNVFEPLVGLDKDLKLQPILAESWENPRPEEWRFHLRKNVFFHDGTPFTAREARQTLEDIRGSRSWQTSNFLNSVETISDLDPYTLAIVTKKPTAILSKLPFVYITKKSGKNFPPFLGTGPYRMVQWKPKQSITLEVWDRYWGPLARIHEVLFIPIEDPDTRFLYLQTGKADIIYSPPMDKIQNPNPEIRVFRRPGITVYYIAFGFRNKENPFTDLKVRKAVHFALNREELINNDMHGNGAIPTQPIAPLVFGFNPDLEPPKYDLDLARKLLAEAGYPSGFETQLDFSAARVVAAEFIQRSLSKIGIKVKLNNVPSVYDYFRSKTSDFYIAGWD